MGELQIAPMNAAGAREAARLEQLCFSRPWSLAALTGELSNPHAVFFTARLNGTVAGYIGMHHILDEGCVTNVAVDPAFRRQGVARALVGHLLQYARQEKLAFVTLEVRPSNKAAISLYESFGFTLQGRRKNYYSSPREDALLLTCFLH